MSLNLSSFPHPSKCELYYVNRDCLFSYNKISEYFLQTMMSLYVSSHYKNEPNDVQLMSDAPAHQLYCLLPPSASAPMTDKIIPDILAVIQIAFEGSLTRKIVKSGLIQGKRLDGDLIPWVMCQQFQDENFGRLSGIRIVRIAVHPHIQSKGYGSRALQLLIDYFEGKLMDINIEEIEESDLNVDEIGQKRKMKHSGNNLKTKKRKIESSEIRVRCDLPPLLTNISERRPQKLDWIGTSYGLTLRLFKFWKKAGFKPVYLRQNANSVTGEYSCVMLRVQFALYFIFNFIIIIFHVFYFHVFMFLFCTILAIGKYECIIQPMDKLIR